MSETLEKVTSTMVKAAIGATFSPPSHQTFFEVSNQTGYSIKSYADAVAIGIWPSTGQEIHGFEVKVSRADFLNEMKNPAKAMPIMQHCHRWSLVCPANMVKTDEVPATWGIWWYKDGVIRSARPAKLLDPVPLSSGFVAALARRAGEASGAVIAKAVNDARADWEKRHTSDIEAEVVRRVGSRDVAFKLLKSMEEAYGQTLNEWDLDGLCKAVSVAAKMNLHQTWNGPASILNYMESEAARLRGLLSENGVDLPKKVRR